MSSKQQKQLAKNKGDCSDLWNGSGRYSYKDAEAKKREAKFAKEGRSDDSQQLLAKLENASPRERIKMIKDEGAVETLHFCMAEAPQTFNKIVSLFKGKEDSLKNAMKIDSLPGVTGAEENLSKFKKINSCIGDAKWPLFLDQNDQLFIHAYIDSHYENIYVDSERFRRLVSGEMYFQFDEGVSKHDIDQFVAAIYGCMIHMPAKSYLYQRVARRANSIFIDSGRDDWLIYKINAEGWSLIEIPEHGFTREENFRPYSCDENTPRASWNEVFDVFGIEDPQLQGLIKIWLAVALIPGIPRPGMIINGPQGSGKTTLASFLRQLVDPVDQPLERFPGKDLKTLELKLHKNHVPSFDNLSFISKEVSDILCQVITRGQFDNRKLYTDSDTVRRSIWKPWILNGINIPGTAEDFLSRVFIVDLGLISPEKRRDEGSIKSELEKLIPGIQALIFDCISAGLKNLENVRDIGFQRLADAHRYSLAMSEVLAMSEDEIDAVWASNKESQDSASADEDILSELIPEFLRKNGERDGSCGAFLEAMDKFFKPEGKSYEAQWPKTPNMLSRRISKLEETLRKKGVVIIRSRSSKSKNIKLSLVTGNDDIHENDDTQKNTVIDKPLESQAYAYSDDNADSLRKLLPVGNK